MEKQKYLVGDYVYYYTEIKGCIEKAQVSGVEMCDTVLVDSGKKVSIAYFLDFCGRSYHDGELFLKKEDAVTYFTNKTLNDISEYTKSRTDHLNKVVSSLNDEEKS